MSEYIVAELINSINSTIYHPIHLTRRIIYISFDVSQHYIVFGANSGGLYVFERHPCTFIKLIPSTEGSVICICISPDEKYFALGTSKGTVSLVENSSNCLLRDIQVYNEHQGNLITSMVWNENSTELYTGDNIGKLSIIIPQNFITKTMFQIPCSTLMQLDTSIVQIDMCSQFLIVSTLSRCYLCDTDKEQYRQIGQKLRYGDFGACFYGSKNVKTNQNEKQILSAFRILSEKEMFVSYDGFENLKIFCARPGSRLWEIQIDGTVVRTHQFKQVLSIAPSTVVPLSDNFSTRYKLKICTSPTKSSSLNFKKMFFLNNRFLLTYTKDGLYIFDPNNTSVIFWTDNYKDILDVKVHKNFIYLWARKNQMYVLLFSNLEDFLTKCILSQNYLLCADLCIIYEKHIIEQIKSSRKLHLLSSLNDKLIELKEYDLYHKFQSLSIKIKEYTEERQNAQKLTSGIYIVDNAHFLDNSYKTEIVSNEDKNKHLSGSSNNILNDTLCEFSSETQNIKTDQEHIFFLMCEQYELKKANKFYTSKIFIDILEKYSNVDDICEIFMNFEEKLQDTDLENEKRTWSYETLLEYASNKKELFLDTQNNQSRNYISKLFNILNKSTENSCICGFPLPKASKKLPKFYEIGCYIFEKTYDLDLLKNICEEIPYMWKHYLKLKISDDISLILPLIAQYNDVETLRMFTNRFTYDLWSDILSLYISLQKGNCLNCGNKISEQFIGILWSLMVSDMIKSIGAKSTTYLLQQNAHDIPPSVLDEQFYQTAIFSSIIDHFQENLRNNSIEFVKKVYESEQNENFEKLLEKYLHKRETPSVHINVIQDNCLVCSMPLTTIPVLTKENIVKLKCGHSFHSICWKISQELCTVCNFI